MSARRKREPPKGPKAFVIAVLLSVLLPGLGHIYFGFLQRAIIWLAGTAVLAVVIGGAEENSRLALAMGAIIGVCAAVDAVVMRRAG